MATPSSFEMLDSVDAKLLRLLQADGRISITRLAEEVNLAPATVHERVARLKREGYILGYEAVLNPAKLASGLLVFAEIRVADATPGTTRALKAAVQACDEVIECHEVAGGFDYLLKTRVPDMGGYREFMASVVWQLPGVREVRAYAVIDEVKNTARIPV
jgi:Lrp/AsnC family leucine-responsive transcriptional regulator